MTVALTVDHAGTIDFQEDLQILTLLRSKLFRYAVADNRQLPDLPAIGDEIAAGHGADLEDAINDLDTARRGADPVSITIAQWADDLAAPTK
jgi:hypothetical protein